MDQADQALAKEEVVAQVQEDQAVQEDLVDRTHNTDLVQVDLEDLVDLAWVEEDPDQVAQVAQDKVDIQVWEEADPVPEDIQVALDQVVIQLQQAQVADHKHKDQEGLLDRVLEIYLEVQIHLVARNDDTLLLYTIIKYTYYLCYAQTNNVF